MDFSKQFLKTLENTITIGALQEARILVDTYPSTKMPYNLKIFHAINRLCQTETPFSLDAFSSDACPFRIVIYKTRNYILNYIATQFANYFEKKGCTLFIFNPEFFSDSSDKLFDFFKQGVHAAFFFNNVGLVQSFQDGNNLWETLSIPCYDFLVDHPMYYADSLDYAPSDTTVLCADKTHANYVKRFYQKVSASYFLPTGGVETASVMPDFSWKNRPIDVLFIGSYKCNTKYPYDQLDHYVTAYLQNNPDQTFDSAIEFYIKNEKKELSVSDEALKEIIESHRFLETNISAFYRKTIMEDIVRHGITIHVYGQGWKETSLPENPHFILHDPVSFEEGISLMAHAKILLNHMAWFKEGSSERIFNALSQGALCLTDSSTYLDKFLVHDENCCIYKLSHLTESSISATISALLSDPGKPQRIARKGWELSKEHTWQKHLETYFSQFPN